MDASKPTINMFQKLSLGMVHNRMSFLFSLLLFLDYALWRQYIKYKAIILEIHRLGNINFTRLPESRSWINFGDSSSEMWKIICVIAAWRILTFLIKKFILYIDEVFKILQRIKSFHPYVIFSLWNNFHLWMSSQFHQTFFPVLIYCNNTVTVRL